MAINPAAGKPAQASNLVNVPRLITAYFADRPDPKIPEQRVTFGTSGHRGSALNRAFNEWHILAVTQAICAYRKDKGIDGPLFLGIDTHALSEPAFATAMEVLAANEVHVRIAPKGEYTPTPPCRVPFSISIETEKWDWRTASWSRLRTIPPRMEGSSTIHRTAGRPPSDITGFIQARANELLENNLDGVKRTSFSNALKRIHHRDARFHRRVCCGSQQGDRLRCDSRRED